MIITEIESGKPIFVVGYMACGKTTFARALARAINREFIDLDFYIEQRFRASVSEIWHTKGEEEFRRIEAAMLREAGGFENVVVSCGGGTPCFCDNMDYMLSAGVTVRLVATEDCIVRRLLINNAKRPLMTGKSEAEMRQSVAQGLAEREIHYSRAHISFDGEELEDRRQIAQTITRFLAQDFPI